jgi:hypothetical protein
MKNGVVFLRSVRRLLVAVGVVPSSPIFVTLMKEASDSSETSVLTRATRRNNPEDTILRDVMCFLWGMNWIFMFQKTTFLIVTAVNTPNLA